MPDTIGRISVPAAISSGLTFPLPPSFGYGTSRPFPLVEHRFGELAERAIQRFQVGIGPRRFTFVRQGDLSYVDKVTLLNFYESTQGGFQTFLYNVPGSDRGASFTSTTVIFDPTQPIVIEELVNACKTGITFIEVPDPSTAPTYTVSSTVKRFPSNTLQTALLSQTQQIIPLIHIRPREAAVPDIYLSDRRCTVGGQLYLPRVLEMGGPPTMFNSP